MRHTKSRTRHLLSLAIIVSAIAIWAALPGLSINRISAHGNKVGAQKPVQSSAGLDPAREQALLGLYAQLKAGAAFSEEEALILRRFNAGGVISILEADTVISRALFDYYISGKELTREQQDLLGQYTQFVARRDRDIADLKTRLLNERKAAAAVALPHTPTVAPANDTCAGAQVIPGAGPFPHLTTTVDILDATLTGDPPAPSCQTDVSRSVWYTFTPTASATYTISSCADAPTATTVDDTVIAIYTAASCAGPFTEIPTAGPSDGCDDDSCVTESLQAFITTTLTGGTQYFIVVWEFDATAPTAGNTALQLRVSQTPIPANDLCGSATTLPLDTPLQGTTVGATNDYQLSGAACFPTPDNPSSTAPGRDVAYQFTAPVAGSYSFRVTNFNTAFNLVLYAASMCEVGTSPITVTSCLSAANRSTASTSEEILCLSLTSGQVIFIFVDENAATAGSTFTIEATNCSSESEPNDTPATADPLIFGGEGAIFPAGDADFYSLGTFPAGSRVFAMIDGVAANSTDFDLRVTTATDTLEYDDLNLDVPFGSLSPTVAGTPLTSAAAFLRINHFQAGTTSRPYRLYATVQPPGANTIEPCTNGSTSSATDETEPNNTTATANSAANNYFEGNLAAPAPSTDVDVFSFTATAGNLVFLGLDADPCRDNTPINARLELLDSAGAVLVVVNDGGSTSSTTPGGGSLVATTPNSPAESIILKVLTTGTYFARVTIGTTSTTGTGAGNYLLSIFTLAPTEARLESFAATGYDGGQFIEWKTGYEVDNLGFNLYREEGGKRVPVNQSMIAGSALVAGARTALTAGRTYGWWDNQSPGKNVAYWLEAVGLNGKSEWHGPISIRAIGGSPPELSQAALLSRVGLTQSGRTLPVMRAAQIPVGNSAAINTQSLIAASQSVKMTVQQEGWYRVNQSDLLAAGFSPDVNPRFIQLFVDGVEQPIKVNGDGDGRFDSGDSVEFYGTGLDTAYSDSRVYWLVAGTSAGRRITTAPAQKSGTPASASFAYAVERKDRTIYFSALKNGDAENFFGPVISSSGVDQSLTLRHIDRASTQNAIVEVGMQGVTQLPHRVRVSLNGTAIGDAIFDNQAASVTSFPVPQSLLAEGENHVSLLAINDGGDVSLISHIRITYPRIYTAESNNLRLTADGHQSVTIGGFTNNQIRVFDITDSGSIQEVPGAVSAVSGGYSIAVVAPDGGQRRLLALTGEQARTPAGLARNQPSGLKQTSNGADLLVITRQEYSDALRPLVALRQSQNLSGMVVDAQAIYDEFSYGQKTPYAIKDFLSYAKNNWKRKPAYVLLAGHASFDARNYLGYGDIDRIPSKLLDTVNMEAFSDDWFADFDGDGLAEMAVGRLSFRTFEEAAAIVSKITGYQSAAPSQSVLLVSDRPDGYNFRSIGAGLKGVIPANLRVEEIDRSELGDVEARTRLVEAINQGQKIVNYAGHGSVTLWRGNLLSADDAITMTNGNNLSLFVTMTCLNGYLGDPVTDSLAEALVKAKNGGAVAAWASSAMTTPGDQAVMNQEVFRLLFDGSNQSMRLGDATKRAKATITDGDVRRTWILFGDPTMRLK